MLRETPEIVTVDRSRPPEASYGPTVYRHDDLCPLMRVRYEIDLALDSEMYCSVRAMTGGDPVAVFAEILADGFKAELLRTLRAELERRGVRC
jgi:hypothetical protein